MGNRNSRIFFKDFIIKLLLALLIFWANPICYSDAGDEFEGDPFDEGLFDEDQDPIFSDEAFEIPENHSNQEMPLSDFDHFLQDVTFTLGYLFSYGTGGKNDIIDNQIFLRIEYDTLLKDNLFFKFDGKSAFHLNNDHLADAKDNFLYIDPGIRELYLQPGFKNFNLTFGKQINVWGKADTAAITDVFHFL